MTIDGRISKWLNLVILRREAPQKNPQLVESATYMRQVKAIDMANSLP